MVKIANVAKAVGVWAGAIYLLYGNDNVGSFFEGSKYLPGLAVSRSPEGGVVYHDGTGKASQYGDVKFQKGMGKGLSYGRETTPDLSLSLSASAQKMKSTSRGGYPQLGTLQYGGGF